MKYYTIGEVYRLKLLLNHKGEPYTTKATVSKVVNSIEYKEVKTAFGPAKVISKNEIDKWNRHWGKCYD